MGISFFKLISLGKALLLEQEGSFNCRLRGEVNGVEGTYLICSPMWSYISTYAGSDEEVEL